VLVTSPGRALVLGAAAVDEGVTAVAGAGSDVVVATLAGVAALVTGAAALGEDVVAVVGAGVAGVAAGAATVSTVEATESVRLVVVD
jgi:hypothetical protein